MGLRWRPSWAQVICSTSSSSVPMPPGSATKASARSNISCLRVCMSGTTIVSCTPSRSFSFWVRKSGMMPVTSPPASRVARATAPMRPSAPPP